ncbi:MAG: sigma 54-interacting transcriptional regulator, partial [Opitutaceae bacterium]
PVDVRIIAATNADLRTLVAAGKFREDLLHRLDLFRVRTPPLRERGDDIIRLAEAIAGRVARNYGLTPPPIPPEGRARLLRHAWPGNVRELAHEIERSLVFEDDKLAFRSLAHAEGASAASPAWVSPAFQIPEGFVLDQAIDALVARALLQSEGNVSAAARLLGVTRDYVRYRLNEKAPGGSPGA